jgi:iron complex outermembrane recepter protein
MKQRALALAIRRIIWAELALTTAIAVPAFAQSQPAAPAAAASGTEAAAAPAAASGAAASTAANKNVKQLKTFEVTGSLIRQSDKTGFQSVQRVTQQDIKNSGAATVTDFLRSTSANSASSWGEGTSSSTSPGGAGIALRGLSEKYTLVLVDGQRVANYALPVNGTDSFFDLNSLPINMVDRIEIVKTGAVSQYGSDAIAGVVNIITKHNFQGLQLDGSLGGASQGGQGTSSFSALGGFGNLSSDGYNVTAALSHYQSSGFTLGQRDTTSGENFLNQQSNGGFIVQPPSYFLPASGIPQATPCAAGHVASSTTNLGASGLPAGTVCAFNSADNFDLDPQTDRTNLKVHADFKINDHIQAFADGWESYNTTDYKTGPQGFNNGTLANVPGSLYFAGGAIAPFPATLGDGTGLTYYFPNNNIGLNSTSNFYRLSTGLRGDFTTPSWGDWNWAASYGHSQSEVANTYTNQLNANVLANYLGSVSQATFNPTTMQNLPGLFQDSNDLAISKLDTIDATISTPNLFTLPTGDVGLGFGAQFQHQSEFIGPGSTATINPITQSVDGERNVAAVYYQIDVPIIHNLTFSQSGRYDHYDDFGGAFSPRFALRYQPVSALTMYASYNRGFRAPTMVETSEKADLVYQSVNGQDINENTIGNPNLQPERTKNYNIGFELSPTRTTDIGLDLYKINVTNVIAEANIADLVAANPGQSVYNVPFENLSYLNTEGLEATLRQALPTAVGTFTFSADWAYVYKFQMPGSNGSAVNYAGNNGAIDTVFGASMPRWRGNTNLSWAYHQWTVTATWQYTSPYTQVIVPGTPSVPSYSQFNLYAQYTGFKHWTLYAGINNIFNRAPPFDPTWEFEGTNSGYDSSLYNYVGRYGQIGATYKF